MFRKSKALVVAYVFLSLFFCVNVQAGSDLQESTINVAATAGKAVVSISSVIKEKIGTGLYFGSPFDEFEDDFFRRFFEEFFGEVPERNIKGRCWEAG